jgi:hypothetical protein
MNTSGLGLWDSRVLEEVSGRRAAGFGLSEKPNSVDKYIQPG